MTLFNKLISTAFALPLCLVSASAQDNGSSVKLQFPVNCTLDQDCFIQQYTDMDKTEDTADPFCGAATYDGHKGTDIRVRTLEDIAGNVEVLAAASGTVKGVRKNRPDRLIVSDADRKAVENVECGNGVVIDHGQGIETQYCHLKQGSPAVSVGDTVGAGDVLGFVGASGMAQFPHLHLSVRKNGQVIDPFTGNKPGQACGLKTDKTWWADESLLNAKRDVIFLGSNLTGAPIEHSMMVRQPPAIANTQNAATVGWVWYSNLKANDRVFIKLQGPNGFEAENLSDPLNRNKANWSGYVGKKRQPKIGAYKLTTYILRGGEKLSLNEKSFVVER